MSNRPIVTRAVCVFDPNSFSSSEPIEGKIEFSIDHKTLFVKVTILLSGFKPNTIHGIHIHEYGDLTKKCESTCSHYNPTGKLHGSHKLHGSDRHAGDLCNNIKADKDGNVYYEYIDKMLVLADIVGRAVVIHDSFDDLGIWRNIGISKKTAEPFVANFNDLSTLKLAKESLKSGNAGKRIACSVIGIAKEKHQVQV